MADDATAVLATAQKRGAEMELTYAGALLPDEAFALVQNGAAVLVDVRTRAELNFVGRINIKSALAIEWQDYPNGEKNPQFIAELKQQIAAATDTDDAVAADTTDADNNLAVLFICRSGMRSHHAATLAAENGFRAFNVLEGFEGEPDEHAHRNTVNGWRARGLPWVQS